MDATQPIAGVKRVMVFGGTGMIGRGIMHECLKDPEVEEVVAVGRSSVGETHPKLREIKHTDFLNFDPIEEEMKNVDACIYSIGVTSLGLDEPTYKKITQEFTLSTANALIKHNPNMTFVFVSAMGTDINATYSFWPRIKAETENTVIEMPWHGYVFRPGIVRAMNGETSRTTAYRIAYNILRPAFALLHWIAPSTLVTTEAMGQAFLRLAKEGSPTEQRIFEGNDMNILVNAPKKQL